MKTEHGCGVTAAGAAMCWGNGWDGQLGNGSTATQDVPTQVLGLEADVLAIATRGEHTCAVVAGGRVLCWGNNESGQLGDGTRDNRYVPTRVRGIESGIVQVSTGFWHTCALTSAGEVLCWGSNDGRSESLSGVSDHLYPTAVKGVPPAISLSAGADHTCVLTTENEVFCWGCFVAGEPGRPALYCSPTPTRVFGLGASVLALSAGVGFTCAITAEGNVECWGFTPGGWDMNGSVPISFDPYPVSGIEAGIVGISSGYGSACAVTLQGEVHCWGNRFSQTADRLGEAQTTRKPERAEGFNARVVDVSVGRFNACAVTDAAKVVCWGTNSYGQLGNGTRIGSREPVLAIGF